MIFLVVLGHAIEVACDLYSVDRSLFLFIYSFHMPAFLFISGLFSKRTVQSEKYPWKKTVPFLLVCVILSFFRDWSIRLRNPDHGYSFYDQSKISWFMLALFACFSVAWLLRKVPGKYVLPGSIVVGLAVGYVPFISEGFSLSRIIVFFPFFYAGYLVDRKKFATFLDKPLVRGLGGSALLLWFTLCFLMEEKVYLLRRLFTGQNNYDEIPNALGPTEFLYRALAYAISAAVILAFFTLVPRRQIPWLTTLGSRTLAVYFWHLPILDILIHTDWATGVLEQSLQGQLLLALGLAVLLTFFFSLKPFQVIVGTLLDPWPLLEKRKAKT